MPKRFILVLMVVLAVAAAGYWFFVASNSEAPAGGAPGGENAAMPIEVVQVQSESYRSWNEFSGRLQAVDSVEVRPQVSGTITAILFEEGAQVKAGQELITIDPRPYEAALAQAKASLASARSQAGLAKMELDRAQALVKQQFLSKSVHDQRRSSYQVAQASIESAEAAYQKAKLDLEYAHVLAPISGKAGRAELTVGNLVEAGPNAPVLTTIVAQDQVYAEFDVDEQTYVEMVRFKENEGSAMPVQLKLAGDEKAQYHGHIQSFDNQLDIKSGTIRARAVFTNADGALIPGMFATVRVGSVDKEDVIRISERAIGVDQNRRFVYVVGEDNKVEYREVALGSMEDGKRVVLSGLNAGEQIIPSGLQRVQPGALVQPMAAPTDATPENKPETPAPAPETEQP